ncbi:hypothetical protein ASD21_09615 [Caulobacter sp. Root1455]|uniref:hypothetical protein n=1 Tax=Caulobacter sp. Root1455 TaxID=1736465 RepID=UPI0006FDD90C|nr:hypothetical protein [Caulobacter sp. Root1455]KQY93837.1 hypothetical protein ASD21_09615 [Caulobacter sp. Root1455]
MAGIAANKLLMVRKLVETAPDAALRSLELALAGPAGGQGALAAVRGLVEDETAARYVRNSVLAPIVPLCAQRDTEQTSFPPRTLTLLWSALKAKAPKEVEEAAARCNPWDLDEGPPEVFNELCKIAAKGLRAQTDAGFQALDAICDIDELASCLELSAIVRVALPRLQEWVSKMSEERASAARLAYKDACKIRPDAGPLLFEMLAAHLPDDWRILRVISAVMERPNDKFWASSEVSVFGERVLTDIAKNIDLITTFDLDKGQAEGRKAAQAAHKVSQEITEFEQSVNLAKDGPWGRRIAKHKQAVAHAVETRMNGAERELLAALPLRPISMLGGKKGKGVPQLTTEPDEALGRRLTAVLTFIAEIRGCAMQSGYGASRAKVLEKLNGRLDQYIEDILHVVRTGDGGDQGLARLYVDLAAGYIAYSRDEKTAEIVRRRAAAAMAAAA